MPPIRPARATFQSLESRLHLDAGVLDTAFGEQGVASIAADTSTARLTDIAVTPDGRIVVTGTSRGDGTLNVARFHANGVLDPTFGDGGRATSQIGGDAQVLAAAVQADHKIVVVGQREQQYFVLRYRTNGKHDRTFGDGGIVRRTFGQNVSEARDVAILDDGSILVAGNARQANGSTGVALAKLDEDGQLVTTFGGIDGGVIGGPGDGTIVTKFGFGLSDAQSIFVERMTVTPGDDILLAGQFLPGGAGSTAGSDVAVMRFDEGGIPDDNFGDGGLFLADFGAADERATGIAVDAQGRPVASVDAAFGALRLLPDGRRDLAFGTHGLARASSDPGSASDVLVDDGGNYVLAGTIEDAPRLARLLPSGAADDAFGTNGLSADVPFTSPAESARVVGSPDGTYVVGGTGGPGQRPPAQFLQLAKYFVDAAPSARLVSARDLLGPRTGSQVFHVQWRDSEGINVATIGPNDVRVTGPNGYVRTAVLASAPLVRAATDVIVRYKVAPPNGTEWTSADNGAYTITALAGGVQNLDGVPSAAATLGTFRVEIA